MRPSELNQLKAAVTMLSVDERAAYARYHEHRPHIASFCGTGNSLQFLSDPTGNRRWLPFEVDSIEPPHDNPLDYNGIYSQAYALYRQGFRYWFTQQEIERLAQHNQQFETANLELELVAQYFRKPQGQEPGEFISAAMALQIIGANITQKLSKEYVGRAFTSLGFDSRRPRRCVPCATSWQHPLRVTVTVVTVSSENLSRTYVCVRLYVRIVILKTTVILSLLSLSKLKNKQHKPNTKTL